MYILYAIVINVYKTSRLILTANAHTNVRTNNTCEKKKSCSLTGLNNIIIIFNEKQEWIIYMTNIIILKIMIIQVKKHGRENQRAKREKLILKVYLFTHLITHYHLHPLLINILYTNYTYKN